MASGVRRVSDTWNMSVVYTMNALLLTAVVPYVLLPCFQATMHFPPSDDGTREAFLSRCASFLLIALFVCYQLFP